MRSVSSPRFWRWLIATAIFIGSVSVSTCYANTLSAEDLTSAIDFAELSDAAYQPSRPFDANGWQRIDGGSLFSGLKWALFERRSNGKRELTLAYAGTDIPDLRDWWTNILQGAPQLFGFRPKQYTQALELAQRFVPQADGDPTTSLTIVGHSLGGGLAQYVAAKLGLRAFTFNAAALGQDTLRELGQLANNTSRQILNFSLHRDPVHDTTEGILESRQLGVNYRLAPAPGLRAVSLIDLPLLAPNNGRDALARHSLTVMVDSLEYERAYGDIRRQVEGRPLPGRPSDPIPSWWAIDHHNKPHEQLLAEAQHLSELAVTAKKVMVVGSGPAVDTMTRQLRTRLGQDNVVRVGPTEHALLMQQATANRVELIVGVRDETGRPASDTERFVVLRSTAEHLASTVSATATALHELGHAIKNKQLRQLLDPGKKENGALTSLGHTQTFYGLYRALEQDVDLARQGPFTLLRSHMVEELAHIGIDRLAPQLFDILRRHNLVRMAPGAIEAAPTFGALDALTGAARHIGRGYADIDTITNYFDAANQAAWATLGWVSSGGNANVASAYQAFGDTAAKLGRAVTQSAFTRGVSWWRGQPQTLEKLWRTAQERRVHDNLPIQKIEDMFGAEVLRTSGVSKAHLTRFTQAADHYEQQRRTRHQSPLPPTPNTGESRGGVFAPIEIRKEDFAQ